MGRLNVEIKARCDRPEHVRAVLGRLGADFRGVDGQVDTYFCCPRGRLKLRQGDIENALIHYDRADEAGPKSSHVLCYRPADRAESDAMKAILAAALGVRAVVAKRREIYLVANVKFHVDRVESLGRFVEIEALQAEDGRPDRDALTAQCRRYMALLSIGPGDLVEGSYGDMVSAGGGEEGGPCGRGRCG